MHSLMQLQKSDWGWEFDKAVRKGLGKSKSYVVCEQINLNGKGNKFYYTHKVG